MFHQYKNIFIRKILLQNMIIQGIVLGIFILLGLMFLKVDHSFRRIKMVALAIVCLLIYFSIMGIFSSEQVDLTSPQGIVRATYIYFGWIGETTSKLWEIGIDTSNLIGNAIKINNSNEDKPKR